MPDTNPQQTLDTNALGGETAPPAAAATELDPRNYQLMETLGAGGMGEVYHCCDPALGRDLAIKVMKKGLHGQAKIEQRFLREARITGSLQHPGIVAVHNLGQLSDGRLHYTMRLVRGRTFAAILKEEAGKPERLPYLLSIFEKICQAAAYAHSKRVLHRDLKPSNVMVGKFGEVQVMDWGLAKVLTSGTAPAEIDEMTEAAGTRIPSDAHATPLELSRTGAGFGTLAYMPPEQALGEWDAVDERADVFALGSILCEMLTGQPAYGGTDGHDVYLRARRGDTAEALARLEQCGADAALTALCRTCLNIQRQDRPRDADAVAKRVAEHQAEVQERLRRAEVERAEAQLKAREGRKQRRLLIALILVLLAGGALTTWQAMRATAAADAEASQRHQAEEQKQLAEINEGKAKESEADTEAVLTFFQDKVLSAGRPKNQEGGLGPDVSLRNAVDAAERDIAKSFADRPVVEASIRFTLGKTYWYLGEPALAIRQYKRALALCEAKFGFDHPNTLALRSSVASALLAAGRTAEAIQLNEQTLQQYEAKLGFDHPDTLIARNNLASAYWSAGRTADALHLHEQNLQQMEAKHGLDHPHTLAARNNLATAYQSAGRITEAIRLHKQILQQREAQLGLDHQDTMLSRNNLAAAYQQAGHHAEALRLHEQNLKLRKDKLGDDHPDTLTSRHNLAAAFRNAGRTADAIHLYRQVLPQREAKRGLDHPDTLISRSGLAEAYLDAGRSAEAIPHLEQNLKLSEAKLGRDHIYTLMTMANLGWAYRDAARLKDAMPLLEEALQRGRKQFGGLPPELVWVPGFLAETYDRDGQFAKAEAIYRDLLEQARRQFGAEDRRTAGEMVRLGFNLLRQHKYVDAEKLLGAALKVRQAKQAQEWTTFNTRSQLGEVLMARKKFTEAEPLLVQGYEGIKQRQDKIPSAYRQLRLSEALERLVRLYEGTNQKEKAADWRKKLDEAETARKKAK